jgi:hypothetical protein
LECLYFFFQFSFILFAAINGWTPMIRLKRISNFWCSMLVYTPFA